MLASAAFYGLYTLVRAARGIQPGFRHDALVNAGHLVTVERDLGLFHERALQAAVLPHHWLIEICDDFYGTFHFLLTAAVLVTLFRRFPGNYPRWRNALALTTAAALVVYYVFPLMPPRLLPAGYGFVDTVQTLGGFSNLSSGPAVGVSNQYAAMPSLHTAWSLWCALAVSQVIRPRWARIAVFAYPAFTVFAIVVTANHYVLDTVAGAVLVAASVAVTTRTSRRHRLPAPPTRREVPVPEPVG